MRSSIPIGFFLDGENTEQLATMDPDRDWIEFRRGERAWILQTYLRLRDAGHPVTLVSSSLPKHGVLVFHSKQKRSLLRLGPPKGLTLVGVRGDRQPSWLADFEIVQNRLSADGRRRFFVPHWPQPGLVPRDPKRGERLERVSYKGFAGNLHPYFSRTEWLGFLAARQIDWQFDAVAFSELDRAGSLDWPNYAEVDLVLAMRPDCGRREQTKPATKLYNAWQAGVPALLGPDIAFRELRKSPHDYLEILTPQDAMKCLQRLLDSPELYRQMVRQGQERGREFSVAQTASRWIEFLTTDAQSRPTGGHSRTLAHRARMSLRRLHWLAKSATAR